MNKDEKFLDWCIKIVFISIFIFTVVMIVLFTIFGSTPDTLIQYFFVYVVGELLSCALIKTTKNLYLNYKMNTSAKKEQDKSESHDVDGQNKKYILKRN